ncbi:MAG: tyrosine recombinase XerC [Elainella sp.]
MGLNSPLNVHNARKLAATIQQDILISQFDSTLEKYRPEPEPETETVEAVSTVELWQQFIEARRADGTSGQAISSRYKPLLSNLQRFGKDIDSEATARKFIDLLRSRQSARIANQNLSLLRGFADWAVELGQMQANPFKGIKPLKEPRAKSQTRKPFSRDEVQRLLATAKTHPTIYQWHDFIMVLLYLGLRPSEAIGLRWLDFDLQRREVTISEALARSETGCSSGSSRVRKDTKTGTARTLTLAPSLLAMLAGRFAATQPEPDALVFTTTTGQPIDDRNFRKRTWQPLCAAAGVPYRVPYACRHTLLSHGIEGGMTLQQAAYVAGHVDGRMVMQTYGHMINRPNLPDWQDPNL